MRHRRSPKRSLAQSLVAEIDEELVVVGVARLLFPVLPDVAVAAAHVPGLRDEPLQGQVERA